MRLLPDEQTEAQRVAERWKAQYCRNGEWGGSRNDPKVIYDSLCAMPSTAGAAEVAAIVGNDSWVGQICNECGERTALVLVGEEPDYESATVYLCAECVQKLHDLINTGRSTNV